MPDKVVEIPGVGNIAFPDSMSDDDIAVAAVKIHAEKQGAFSIGPLERAGEQFVEKSPIGGAIGLVKGVANVVRHPIDTWLGAAPLADSVKDLLRAHYDQGVTAAQKAKAAYVAARSGDAMEANLSAIEAMGHGVAALVPVLGPMAADVGEHFARGDLAGGVGGMVGLLSPFAVAARRAPAAPVSRLNPAEASAVAFADEHGVPLDAATLTGSRTARAMQKRVANSMGGEGTAERLVTDQRQALTRVGQELADETHPATVTPAQAGEGVSEAVKSLMSELNTQANAAYGRLREIEGDPRHSMVVQTAPLGTRTYQALLNKLAAGLEDGQPPLLAELKVMRQIEAELDAQPFTRRLLQPAAKGGGLEHVPGTGGAGAPVYHDILQAAPGTADMTRDEVLRGVRKALEQGEWTNAGRGALEVARKRLRAGQLGGPLLDPNAPVLGTSERVGLPVDLRKTKQTLYPLYERLLRESELVPMQGDKARALVALDRLIGGPDVASASVVDAALGDLKAMARTDVPELRTHGQGLVAQAVKTLDPVLQEAVRRAGPDALRALEEGRGTTIAKYWAGDVLRQLVGQDANRMEPVKVLNKLLAPNDSAITLLTKVKELAPAKMPELGRAYLEDLLTQSTSEGGFDKAAKLQAEWQKLGPQTKRILFSANGQTQALDHFFLLAKRMAENPNPSGTAHALNVLNVGSTPAMWMLSKLLYTPRGAKALSRFMSVSAQLPSGATRAMRTSAWLDVVAAARAAGVDMNDQPVPR